MKIGGMPEKSVAERMSYLTKRINCFGDNPNLIEYA